MKQKVRSTPYQKNLTRKSYHEVAKFEFVYRYSKFLHHFSWICTICLYKCYWKLRFCKDSVHKLLISKFTYLCPRDIIWSISFVNISGFIDIKTTVNLNCGRGSIFYILSTCCTAPALAIITARRGLKWNNFIKTTV